MLFLHNNNIIKEKKGGNYMEKKLKELEVDFFIPPILKESIQGLKQEVNSGGLCIDCWQDDIRASINICLNDGVLSEEQGELLRNYYYRQTF